MVASDPHLSLASPSTFYEVGHRVDGARDLVLYGVTFPGAPAVVHGINGHVAWGSTVNPTDVTDVFQETVVTSRRRPGRDDLQGQFPCRRRSFPESYRANQPGTGRPTTSSWCRRRRRAAGDRRRPAPQQRAADQRAGNRTVRAVHGLQRDARERTTSACSRARTTSPEASDALRYFDFGAQNWMFADDSGNIAY